MSFRAKFMCGLGSLCLAGAAWPSGRVFAAEPGAAAQAAPAIDCRAAAEIAERDAGLPAGLLLAIGKIESGRFDPRTGQTSPWPWSADLDGGDHVFETQTEALAWTGDRLAEGRQSIDVGCFQVNLFYHPNAFASLEEAFDPLANARYAARFLTELYRRNGSWPLAVAQYHSADPALGTPYGHKVYATWGAPADAPGPPFGGFGGAFDPRGRSLTAAPDRVIVRISARALLVRVIIPTAGTGPVVANSVALTPRRTRSLPRIVTPS